MAIACKGLIFGLNFVLSSLPLLNMLFKHRKSTAHGYFCKDSFENKLLRLKERSLDGTWLHKKEHSRVDLVSQEPDTRVQAV